MASAPSHWPQTARQIVLGTVVALATLVAMTLLPHSRYVRWQATRNEAFARLGWIYERIHYDATPIDVAFVGTSHTLNSIDGALVERAIAEAGGRMPDGRCVTVSNLAMPMYGRNMHWAIVRELLGAKRPALLVIDLYENESRKSNAYFAAIADPGDLVSAPLLVNPSYFSDLARLPWRQFQLAIESMAPRAFGLKDHFSLADYDGSTVDNTYSIRVDGRELTPPRTRPASASELDAHVAERLANRDLSVLGPRLARYEYASPLRYYGGLLDLARAKGVPVLRAYLPTYGQGSQPDLALGLGKDVPMFAAPDIMAPRSAWYDADHLGRSAAEAYSQRIGQALAARFKPAGGAPVVPTSGCNFGVPERRLVQPFVWPRDRHAG